MGKERFGRSVSGDQVRSTWRGPSGGECSPRRRSGSSAPSARGAPPRKPRGELVTAAAAAFVSPFEHPPPRVRGGEDLERRDAQQERERDNDESDEAPSGRWRTWRRAEGGGRFVGALHAPC